VAITIPMYFFEPFIHTNHVIFVVAGKNSYFVTFLILGQANVTPVSQKVITKHSPKDDKFILVQTK
jgi:hypothetical protein